MKYAIRVLLACVAVTGFLGCVPRRGVYKAQDTPPPAVQSKPGQPAVEQHDTPAVDQQDAPAVEQK